MLKMYSWVGWDIEFELLAQGYIANQWWDLNTGRLYELSIAVLQITPKLRDLKQHLLSHTLCGSGIRVGLSWVFWLSVPHRLHSRLVSKGWSYQGSMGGGLTSIVSHVFMDRIQFLVAYWTEGLSSSLNVGQSLPIVPCHMGLSIRKFTTWQVTSLEQGSQKIQREREGERKC